MFTETEYIRGLSESQAHLSDTDLRMLRFHYFAHEHTVTPLQMSTSFGWLNGGTSHLHYGRLGKKLAQAMQKNIKKLYGTAYPVRVLAEFTGAAPVKWIMWDNLVEAIKKIALFPDDHVIHFPEEVSEAEKYFEGATFLVHVNLYERSSRARAACIRHHGSRCIICDFDFAAFYSPSMQGFIHVHHLRSLSEISETYQVDPVHDLVPVCPNCHAVIHSRKPAYSIEEVRELITKGVAS
jgi:5-methylcytosine-specific restriction enzyme A